MQQGYLLICDVQKFVMEAESPPLPFKNCSGFTDEEFAAVALASGITAAVCCGVSFTL